MSMDIVFYKQKFRTSLSCHDSQISFSRRWMIYDICLTHKIFIKVVKIDFASFFEPDVDISKQIPALVSCF